MTVLTSIGRVPLLHFYDPLNRRSGDAQHSLGRGLNSSQWEEWTLVRGEEGARGHRRGRWTAARG